MSAAGMITETFNFIGSYQSSRAKARMAKARANAAEFKRRIAERNEGIVQDKRTYAFHQAATMAEDHRRNSRRILANMRANMGNNGVAFSGSQADAMQDAAIEQELGARRIRHRGQLAGYESELQIIGLKEQGRLHAMERDVAMNASRDAKAAGNLAMARSAAMFANYAAQSFATGGLGAMMPSQSSPNMDANTPYTDTYGWGVG